MAPPLHTFIARRPGFSEQRGAALVKA